MKSVLLSIQPYYVFLIIARLMGWNIPQEKKVEVRKDFPKDSAWNRRVHIYCSKNRRSFNRIPKQYQPLMEKFLGKVVGEFVCDRIYEATPDYEPYLKKFFNYDFWDDNGLLIEDCLSDEQKDNYAHGETLYGWHISDLKIYDKPKELREFYKVGFNNDYEAFACAGGGVSMSFDTDLPNQYSASKLAILRPIGGVKWKDY